MTRVLLITDIQRVQRVFEALETKKTLELRIAATLTLADLELSSSVPELTFVQSRISGFSGLIMLRYLKKSLPKDAKIIMLAGDAEDVALAKKLSVPFIDLAGDDEALAAAITTFLGGKRRSAPKKPAAGEVATGQAPTGTKSRVTKAVASKSKAVKVEAVPTLPDSEEPVQPVPDSTGIAKPVPASAGTLKPLSLRPPEKSEDEQELLPEKRKKQFARQKIESKLIREQPELPTEAAKPPVDEVELSVEEVELSVEEVKPPVEEAETPVEEAETPVEEAETPVEEAETPVEETETPVIKESSADVQSENPGSAKKVEAESFEEIMRRASVKSVLPASAPLAVEDRVDVASDAAAPTEPWREALNPGQEKSAIPVSVADFIAGEEISSQIRRSRKKKHLLWVIPLALVLVLIPLLSYLAGRKAAPHDSLLAPKALSHPAPGEVAKPAVKEAPKPAATEVAKPAPKEAAPPVAKEVAKPITKEAPKPIAKEAPKPSANAAAKPAPVPAAKPLPGQTTKPDAKPVAKEGTKALPPIVADTKPDPAYGKTHPGWSRFVGNKVEYKLFKEGELYRALQVIPLRGETISDPFFRRVLQEFAGTDRCQLQSTGKKGDYLMEQCVTKGGVAVTMYRNKDHKIKGFVLYYR
jgi:hypothetical protein